MNCGIRRAHLHKERRCPPINWALRNIGKRNLILNKRAIKVAEGIKKMDSKAARWIAADALRELTSDKVKERLKNKE